MRGPLALLLILGAGCPESDDPPAIVPDDYAERFVEVRDCRFSVEHDAVYIRVLAPPTVAEAYRDGVYPFEAGDSIVKVEYRDAACSDLSGLTAMERLGTGDDPDLGDWQWQRLDSELRPVDVDPASCAACHRSCTMGRDFACADP